MPAVDDDVPEDCPLCLEEMDLSDRHFRPCVCGYQICRFCWHHIREELNGLCPACRRPYSEEGVQFTPISAEELSKAKKKKGKDKPKEPEKTEKPREADFSKKQLSSLRVMQKTLVYVIGIPLKIATEETLKSPSYFGQYGKIVKIIVNKRNVHTSSHQRSDSSPATASAYITFDNPNSAALAIQAVDGTWLDNCLLRASFGTTKYCANFLRGLNCTNPDCLYLHELMDKESTFTREEMAQGKHQLRFGAPNVELGGKRTEEPPESSSPAARGEHRSSEITTRALSTSDSSSKPASEDSGPLPKGASWARVASQDDSKHSADVKRRSPSPLEAAQQPSQGKPATQPSSPAKATAAKGQQQQQSQKKQSSPPVVPNGEAHPPEPSSDESARIVLQNVPAYSPFASNYSLLPDLTGIITNVTQPPQNLVAEGPNHQGQQGGYDPFFHRTLVQPQQRFVEQPQSQSHNMQSHPQPMNSIWNQPSLLEGVHGILGSKLPQSSQLRAPFGQISEGSSFKLGYEELNSYPAMNSDPVGGIGIESLLDESPFTKDPDYRSEPSISSAMDLSRKWTPLGLPTTPAFRTSWSISAPGIGQPAASSAGGLWSVSPQGRGASYGSSSNLGLNPPSHLFDDPAIISTSPPPDSGYPRGGLGLFPSGQPFSIGASPVASLAGPEGSLWSFASSQASSPSTWSSFGGQQPLPASSSHFPPSLALPGIASGEEERFPPGSRFASRPPPSARHEPGSSFLTKLRDLSQSPPPASPPPILAPEQSAARLPQHPSSSQQPDFVQGLAPKSLPLRPDPLQFPFGSLQKAAYIDAWDDQGEGANVSSNHSILQTPFSVGNQSRDLGYLPQPLKPGSLRLTDDDDFDLEYSKVAEEFMLKNEGLSDQPFPKAIFTAPAVASVPSASSSLPAHSGAQEGSTLSRSKSPSLTPVSSSPANPQAEAAAATTITAAGNSGSSTASAKGKKKKKGNQPQPHEQQEELLLPSPPSSPPPQQAQPSPQKPKQQKQLLGPPNPAPVPEELLAVQRLRQQQEAIHQVRMRQLKEEEEARQQAEREAKRAKEREKAAAKERSPPIQEQPQTKPLTKKEKKREREREKEKEKADATPTTATAVEAPDPPKKSVEALEKEVASAKLEAQLLESQLRAIMELTNDLYKD